MHRVNWPFQKTLEQSTEPHYDDRHSSQNRNGEGGGGVQEISLQSLILLC